jgi:hypothetical protein
MRARLREFVRWQARVHVVARAQACAHSWAETREHLSWCMSSELLHVAGPWT